MEATWNKRASLADTIERWARETPERPAILDGEGVLTWREYDASSDQLAAWLEGCGLEPGERVAVWLPDSRHVHIAFVAIEKAGLVAVGIGPRAGRGELRHLLAVTGAVALVSAARHGGLETSDVFAELRAEGLALRHHVVVGEESGSGSWGASTPRLDGVGSRRLAPDEIFLLNSTSGTTGLPKCVCHDQRRWFFFHELAVRTGRLGSDDVFMSVVPAPFGFGIWTSHVSPALLGVPTVVMSSFDADRALRLLETHGVTVLAAVSTQFIMMLESPALEDVDLSALRVLYTGGEAVPYERAARFEERTGAAVLQFYGSNEAGALSGTSLDDPRERRLRTAGRVIPEMNVRLFDPDGNDVTASGRGEPGCRGPTLSRGYYADPEANSQLFREDGWMRVNDIVSIDREGYLCVVGRTGDFIIRGGKNISGPAVEEAVATHPAVALAAAVAMPDAVFGERVCVYVELRPGCSLTLPELVAWMLARGSSKEMLPERLVVMDALPRGSGGKVAKQVLREAARLEARER